MYFFVRWKNNREQKKLTKEGHVGQNVLQLVGINICEGMVFEKVSRDGHCALGGRRVEKGFYLGSIFAPCRPMSGLKNEEEGKLVSPLFSEPKRSERFHFTPPPPPQSKAIFCGDKKTRLVVHATHEKKCRQKYYVEGIRSLFLAWIKWSMGGRHVVYHWRIACSY